MDQYATTTRQFDRDTALDRRTVERDGEEMTAVRSSIDGTRTVAMNLTTFDGDVASNAMETEP